MARFWIKQKISDAMYDQWMYVKALPFFGSGNRWQHIQGVQNITFKREPHITKLLFQIWDLLFPNQRCLPLESGWPPSHQALLRGVFSLYNLQIMRNSSNFLLLWKSLSQCTSVGDGGLLFCWNAILCALHNIIKHCFWNQLFVCYESSFIMFTAGHYMQTFEQSGGNILWTGWNPFPSFYHLTTKKCNSSWWPLHSSPS